MDRSRGDDRDAEILPQSVSERVLLRASELDVASRTGASIAQLRAAARDAGISAEAFDAAVEELRAEESRRVPRRRHRVWGIAGVTAIVALIVFIGVGRLAPPVAASGPVLEQTLVLRCVSTGQALALIRPLLTHPANVVTASQRAPGMITVRATAEQLTRVQAVIDGYERTVPACVVPSANVAPAAATGSGGTAGQAAPAAPAPAARP